MNAYQPPPLRDAVIDLEPIGDWMSELGLAYEKAGDGMLRGGHPYEAAEKYEAALSIFTRLAAKDPNNNFAASRLRQVRRKIG